MSSAIKALLSFYFATAFQFSPRVRNCGSAPTPTICPSRISNSKDLKMHWRRLLQTISE